MKFVYIVICIFLFWEVLQLTDTMWNATWALQDQNQFDTPSPPGSSSIIEQRCDGGALFGQKGGSWLVRELGSYLENKLYLISINLKISKNQPQLPEIPGIAKRTSPTRLLWRGSNDGQAGKTGSCFFWGLCCNQCWSACRIRKLVEVLSFETWEVFNQSYFESLSWTGNFGRWKSTSVKTLEKTEETLKEQLMLQNNFWMTKGPSLPKSCDKSVQGSPCLKCICQDLQRKPWTQKHSPPFGCGLFRTKKSLRISGWLQDIAITPMLVVNPWWIMPTIWWDVFHEPVSCLKGSNGHKL